MKLLSAMLIFGLGVFAQTPPSTLYTLPNGWKVTPAGKAVTVEDMVLNLVPSPDGKTVLSLQGGYNPEGIAVIDTRTDSVVQTIPMRTAWLGMAWSTDRQRLYVSGGNGNGKKPYRAPVYVFRYEGGRLSDKPVDELQETIPASELWWSGLVHHPTKPLLYAANRGTGANPGSVVVFDTEDKKLLARIPVEVNPYQVVLNQDGSRLYVSNWASSSVSVIDTASAKVVGRVAVDRNPNDMKLAGDGRLFVSCANDNSVVVIDTKTRRATERISTALFPQAPEGSTPNALALDCEEQTPLRRQCGQ